ncbi:MAG: type II toxin-antitoxin system HicA family toxin [Ignavibacteria bacterium]|nr:type II toxin-antitoxin system HicA family toxin [Ignavibacteria bacterium]
MKRKEFVRELVRLGCSLHRRGSEHDIYLNPKNGKKAPLPRHAEIKKSLCEFISTQFGLAR